MATLTQSFEQMAEAYTPQQAQMFFSQTDMGLGMTQTAVQNSQNQQASRSQTKKRKATQPLKGSVTSWTTRKKNYLANASKQELSIATSGLDGHVLE